MYKEKRVLIIGKLPPPYQGTAIWMKILSNNKFPKKFKLLYFNSSLNTTIFEFGKFSFIKILKSISLYFYFIKMIIRERPQLVLIPISQTTIGFIKDSIYIILSKIFVRNTLLMLHGGDFLNWLNKANKLVNLYVKKINSNTSGIIVLGKKLRCLFKDFFSEEKIFTVSNGIDIKYFTVTKRKEICILFLGNLLKNKGILEYVNSIDILRNKYKNTRFLAVGNWDDNKIMFECKRILGDGLFSKVFIGARYNEEKYKELFLADIFVFPPVAPEGHPFVIIEAMAAGLPIIATDQGAITESVINGYNGYIVDAKRPDLLAEKLSFLIENPEKRKEMGENSKKLYSEYFTERKMIENLSNVFNKVLNS
jgi:glycosyltransferase involved in cell wall biosynthesis